MRTLPRSVVRRTFLRSFTIQGSWNYRTLQGAGFAYALLPVLRWLYRNDPERLQEAVRRHTGLFNAHPYLAGVALGAVARMELDGEDPALIERFKNALRGSLGTLGDRIVWAGWRPACVLLGMSVLLTTTSATAAVLVFLVVYNLGHIALRWWGLQIGVEYGLQVGERLRRAPLANWHDGIVGGAAVLLGLVLPLVMAGGLTASRLSIGWMLLAATGGVVGWRLGAAVRPPVLLAMAVVAVAGFLFRLGQ